MKSTIAVVVLLLLAPWTGSGAATLTQAVTSAEVAQATAATPVASKPPTDVPLRQRTLGQTAGLVALFGALAGVGFFVARAGRRGPATS